ncbi:A-kinase anchor protein 4 [Lemmus lemmus]
MESLTMSQDVCAPNSQGAAGSSSEGELNLENLEEKEIIVIKDTEKQDQSKVT